MVSELKNATMALIYLNEGNRGVGGVPESTLDFIETFASSPHDVCRFSVRLSVIVFFVFLIIKQK